MSAIDKEQRILRQNRDLYHFWHQEQVRFSDLDPLGHVNNNAFGVFFESARVAFITECGAKIGPSDLFVILARIEIDFLKELHYPNKIDIGLSISKLGRSSMHISSGIFLGDQAMAISEAVCVILSKETRKPTQIPDVFREAIKDYCL